MWRLLLLLPSLAACGDDPGGATAGDPPAAPAAVVSCGGDPPGWPVTAMTDGLVPVTPTAEIEDALARTRGEMGVDGPQSQEWIVLAEDDDWLTLGTGTWSAEGPGEDALVVRYARTADGLDWAGHGQCTRLAPVLPDGGSAWVALSAPEGGLDRSASDLPVRVMEHQCTGARDPLPFLDEPLVEEGPDRVVVSWTSSVPKGAATCPGNPWTGTVLHLDEPLGDRELVDASTWPATTIE